MNIVLFQPRGFAVSQTDKQVYSLAATMPPLGLLSIAAVLRKNGHDVTVFDASLRREISNEHWARNICDRNPDLVGFSAMTPAFHDAYEVCQRVKQCRDSIRTVFGGVHASWGKDELLRRFDAIDCLVAGEGETAMCALAAGKPDETIEGLYFRNGTQIHKGPEQSTLCIMDELPFPAYDLLDGFPRSYNLPLFSYPRHPGASIVSSRGCVYRCSYCDRSVFGRSFRWNSPEYTFEQVQKLRTDFGIRHVIFYDDLFTLNRARVSRLCGLLRSARQRVSFNCIVRIGHIDRDLIGELKSAGCWMVNVGIESGDQAILDSHKEGLKLEDIRRDVRLLHESGIWVKGLFMMGFPGETEASIVKTIEFACSLPLKDANVTAFTPYPGAPISAEIESLGTLDNNWSKMDCTQFVFVNNSVGSRDILERRYGEFISRFYNRPFARSVYRRMLVQSPHSYWRLLKNLPVFLGYSRSMRNKKK